MADIVISTALLADEAAIRRLLVEVDLPESDRSAHSLKSFLVSRVDDRLIGAVGLEFEAYAVLLRSLAVHSRHRRQRIGAPLTRAAEHLATENGVKNLYLLTTTAAAFFGARGYAPVDRRQALIFILGTSQFAGLCPASTVLMMKMR